jgi:hypothetical protein
MNYELKDKIKVTSELLSELEMKGWQEIEHLQAQIANLAEGPTNNKLCQLLKNLLTSYYVFTGGIETLASEPVDNTADITEIPAEEPVLDAAAEVTINDAEILAPADDFTIEDNYGASDYQVSEPFEYFVDFDDPIGEPLSDEDLYNN